MADIHPHAVARFWSKVAVRRDSQCWLWRGAVDRHGYGQFKIKSGQPPSRAHRVAYLIMRGRDLPSDVLLLHRCNEPRCCNPAHLREGDHRANAADRMRFNRGLEGMPRGSTLNDVDPATLTPQARLF